MGRRRFLRSEEEVTGRCFSGRSSLPDIITQREHRSMILKLLSYPCTSRKHRIDILKNRKVFIQQKICRSVAKVCNVRASSQLV